MARRGRRRARVLEQELAGARKKLDEAVRAQRAAVPRAAPVSLTPKDLA